MGDDHRIPKVKDKAYSDPCFEKLLTIEIDRLGKNLSPFFTRPAYAYTKQEIGKK